MRAAPLMRGVLTAALLLLTAAPAAAQRWALREVRERGLAGVSLALAMPVGEFANYVGDGGGLDAFVTVHLDRAGLVGMRIDGSLLAYGRTNDWWYDGPYYAVPATTTSFIASLRAGPQLLFGTGPVRLYGFYQGGISYFATTTGFNDGYCGCNDDAITEHDDVTLAWEAGGGMLLGLGRRVMLDLGARYLRNGRAEYLPARLVSAPDGVIESQANLVALHLGVTFRLR